MKIKAYSRVERKAQIKATLAIRLQHERMPQATMYQLAKSLEMSPSTHLTGILNEMVKAGELQKWSANHRPGVTKYIYGLPLGSYELPVKANRAARLTARGMAQGELLL